MELDYTMPVKNYDIEYVGLNCNLTFCSPNLSLKNFDYFCLLLPSLNSSGYAYKNYIVFIRNFCSSQELIISDVIKETTNAI